MSPHHPPDIPAEIEEELSGSHRRPEPDPPVVDSSGMMTLGNGIKVPVWIGILMFLFGSGTGAVGGGAVDVFGLKSLRADVAALESTVVDLRAELVESRHKQDMAMLKCGCDK